MKRQLLQFVLLILLGVVSREVLTDIQYVNGRRRQSRTVRIVQQIRNVRIVRVTTFRNGYGPHHPRIEYRVTRTEID
jgi:hypothetical protein